LLLLFEFGFNSIEYVASPLYPTISLEVPLEVKVISNFTIAFSIFLPVVASLATALTVDVPLPLTVFCDDSIDIDMNLVLLL
jgi:hypothetical protein